MKHRHTSPPAASLSVVNNSIKGNPVMSTNTLLLIIVLVLLLGGGGFYFGR